MNHLQDQVDEFEGARDRFLASDVQGEQAVRAYESLVRKALVVGMVHVVNGTDEDRREVVFTSSVDQANSEPHYQMIQKMRGLQETDGASSMTELIFPQ